MVKNNGSSTKAEKCVRMEDKRSNAKLRLFLNDNPYSLIELSGQRHRPQLRQVVELILILAFVAAFVYSLPGRAQTFTGPAAFGLGGAGVAAVAGAEAPLMNPAALAHTMNYQFGAFHQQKGFEGLGSVRDYGGVFIDHNPDAVIPGALTYFNRTRLVGPVTLESTYIEISFGNFLYPELAFGISGKYFKQKVVGSDVDKTIWNGSLGLLYTPASNIGLALVSTNFVKDYNGEIYPDIAFGAHYVYEKVIRARLDVRLPQIDNADKKGQVMFGFESVLAETVFLRAGFRWDDLNKKNFATAGIGWDGPRLGFDYAFEKNVLTEGEIGHSVDLRLFF